MANHNGLLVPAAAVEGLVLEGLGCAECQLDDGRRVIRLSRRHSEILTILSDYPDGLTSEQLVVELYDDNAALSTVRAEMTRVRTLLGETPLESGSIDLMIAWTRARWGADDLEIWERLHRLLPNGSPLRPIAAAEIARLRAEYGLHA